jgi:type I restriction enzyme S subunit
MSYDLPNLPDGWIYKTLEDCARKQSISYGVVQPGAALLEGVPIVRVNNFKDGHIELNDLMKISPEIESKYARTRLSGGEVLITLVGSVGQVAVAPKSLSGFNVARAVAVIHPKEDVNPNWIAICLRSPLSQQLLASRANTTVQTTINLKDLRALPLPFPPEEERDQIERFIYTLDDRIALLRETNNTLEAIAQALFKSWFVDFDPVLANAGSQEPSLPPEIQALFPATFTDTAQGTIPEGWKISELSDYLDVLATGRRPKGGVASFSEGIPSIGAESINGIGKFDFAKTKFVPLEFFEKMKSGLVEDYDVLLYKDGGKPGEFKPRVSMFGNSFPFKIFVINEHVFRMRSDYLGQAYLYFYVSHEKTLSELRNRGGKAAIPGINQTDVRTLKLAVPPQDVLAAFQTKAEPILSKILANACLSSTLANLRDSVLPRLVSGQLRLPEAEQAIMELDD